MRLVNLTCTNCGAELQIDPERREVYCSYCGTRLLVDDDNIQVTQRIVDEARLMEAEIRLRELEYAHERELREEKLREEQKKSHRIAVLAFLAALVVCAVVPVFRGFIFFVLILGGIALLVMSSDDKRGMRQAEMRQAEMRQAGTWQSDTWQSDTWQSGMGQPDMWDSSRKSRVVALVLCIFLGELGFHYFYVGRIGMGILYIFTLGFFGIGWFIDIIRILCGTFRDSRGMYLR